MYIEWKNPKPTPNVHPKLAIMYRASFLRLISFQPAHYLGAEENPLADGTSGFLAVDHVASGDSSVPNKLEKEKETILPKKESNPIEYTICRDSNLFNRAI